MSSFKAFLLCSKPEKAAFASDTPYPRMVTPKPATIAPTTNSRVRLDPRSVAASSSQNPLVVRTKAVTRTSAPSVTRTSNSAFEKAIERHIQELSDADRIAFSKASTSDITELLARVRKLDQEHSKQSSFRPYTTRITNFLNIFQLSVGGVSVFLQAEPVASMALGGAKLVIGLALSYVEYFDKLSKMLDDLSKLLAPLSRYAEKCNLPNICDALADVYADILKFYSAARKLFVDETGSAKRFPSFSLFLRSQWEPFDTKFGEIKSSLQYNCNVLLHSGLSELLVDSEKEKEEFHRWLTPNNFELKKAKSLEARHKGTCDWLFATPQFGKWLSSPKSEILWCHGKPGSGKSILASQVIQYIQDRHLSANDGICFAYFTLSNTTFKDSDALILALLNQLCRHRDPIPKWLLRAKKEGQSPLENATTDNFLRLAEPYARTFVVIDGLDECPDAGRRSVLVFIRAIISAQTVFKVFVTGRKKADIARDLDRRGVLQVTTDSKGTADDINLLIRQKTASLRLNRSLLIQSDALFNQVVSTLIQKADGMFLWVTLQLDYLCSLETDTDIKSALDELPMSLTETYARILEDIRKRDQRQKNIAIACFRWLLSANTEPRWAELESVLSLARTTPPKSLEECRDCPSITYVASACGNLVHIPKQSKKTISNMDEKITFIHGSVLQFFSQNLSGLDYVGNPWTVLFDGQTMHYKNALDCLAYINLLVENLYPFDHPNDAQDRFLYDSFAYYAIHNFDKHLIASGEPFKPSSSSVAFLERFFARDEKYLTILLQLRVLLKPDISGGLTENYCVVSVNGPVLLDCLVWTTRLYKIFQTAPWRKSPVETLLALAQGGIDESMNNFVQEGLFDFTSKDDGMIKAGYHALIYAAAYGNTSVVKLLLHKGVLAQAVPVWNSKASLDWYDHETPLSLAIEGGFESMVEHLLQFGVDVNIPINYRGELLYPLQMAVSYGRRYDDMDIARLLVAAGAERRQFGESQAVGGAKR